MAEKPTQSFLDHLKLREGFESYVYADSLKKLTAGTGHLLTKKELLKYKEGDKIDETDIARWLEEDSSTAYNAAISQAKEAGITDQAFIEALGSVNFQLGTGWRAKFKGTWNAIKAGDFKLAAEEAMYKDPSELDKGPPPKDRMSSWFQQTPVRVNDFTAALKNYGMKKDRESLNPDEAVMDAILKEAR